MYQHLLHAYIRGTNGIVIILYVSTFSLVNHCSDESQENGWQQVEKWYKLLTETLPYPVPSVIIGNKVLIFIFALLL